MTGLGTNVNPLFRVRCWSDVSWTEDKLTIVLEESRWGSCVISLKKYTSGGLVGSLIPSSSVCWMDQKCQF